MESGHVSEETSRVAMVWPTELKERVRQVAGARGITDFTITAVEASLKAQGLDKVPLAPKQPVVQKVAQLPAGGPLAVDRPERQVPPPPPEPELLVDDSGTCKACGQPLIDGECWSCPA